MPGILLFSLFVFFVGFDRKLVPSLDDFCSLLRTLIFLKKEKWFKDLDEV